ncbi:helix-turn-helix domain-containing protein [Streptomyces platensis]|uniref:helix-turn-helix domain-containing protein n=1 Tax=Streptomyces platensis TaxID=58346 RepID=UPI00386B6D83
MGTETAEFAGQLRGLKERSGRSYGVLAGQLRMSVATLHRYCHGDAVPRDFAPADRLARRCGATPDELVELHRRWILADEARRRGRGGAAGATSSHLSVAARPSARCSGCLGRRAGFRCAGIGHRWRVAESDHGSGGGHRGARRS